MFYDRFVELCNSRGVTPSRAALDAGISKSLVTKWKINRSKMPSADVIQKLSAYFDIPVSEFFEEKSKKAPTDGEREVSDDDVKFALFGGDGEITDAMYAEVKSFADFVKRREAEKKQKG